MLDAQGRPYFLWDMDMTLEELERTLKTAARPVREYLIGKLMRQAKPDDALQFVSAQEMAAAWPGVVRYLGRSREFWTWLLDEWKRRGLIDG